MTISINSPEEVLLRLPTVLLMTGIKKTMLYGLIRDGSFPAPVKIGARVSVWPMQAVQAWIDSQVIQARSLSRSAT